MIPVEIHTNNDQTRFTVGETVSGSVKILLPETLSVPDNVSVSFNCVGEVRCSDPPKGQGHIYFGDDTFYEELLKFTNADIIQDKAQETHKKVTIPFSFLIPKDKNLPSTFTGTKGFIRYFLLVNININGEIKNFSKDLIVQAPIDQNLKIAVNASAEKVVLFHSGTVAMQASIDRKGFAPGETVTVHVSVDNKINAKITPRIALQQVQIYMSGHEHKTVETTLAEQTLTNEEIGPHSEAKLSLDVTIPPNEWFSIKSSLITVKYFTIVSLVIPHSLELHVNLPIVVTSKQVIDELAA